MKTRWIVILFVGLGKMVYSQGVVGTAEAFLKEENKLKGKSFLAFPEARENPLRRYDSVEENKIQAALREETFRAKASKNEIFVFQIGVWALKENLNDVKIIFSDWEGSNTISSKKTTCYNLGGIDFMGNAFVKKVNIEAGRVQAFWIAVDLKEALTGEYKGTATVQVGEEKQEISVVIQAEDRTEAEQGYDKGARLSRLNWLNSSEAINEDITKGYIAVKAEGRKFSVLGRSLTAGSNGLPQEVRTYFNESNQALTEEGEPIVKEPFRFVIEKSNGQKILLVPQKFTITQQTPSRIAWKVLNTSPQVDLECTAQMEYDGFVDYQLKLTAKTSLSVKDIRLEIPFEEDKATYMMGLGHEGGVRTEPWNWKWDVARNQDMLWTGGVNGGIRIKWKAENYVRPLVNIYYEFGKLNLPPSWGNEGKGGVNVSKNDAGKPTVNSYSGERALKAGDELNYNFELLITPVKLLDPVKKYNERYYHRGGGEHKSYLDSAKKYGANIINIHHAEEIYPFINYPYLDDNTQAISALTSQVHGAGKRIKFYYTTRELTKNLPEFWALYSLNGEVIFPGPGNAARTEALHPKGPGEWLMKNLREKYIPAWYNTVNSGKFKGELDISVITVPDSRMNNFYVAGLDWMTKHLKIDGVYIDDSALDHFTMRRVRKIIETRPEGRADIHSWNHFCSWAGFASCLNLYMDLLPYADMVWIGEGRDYDRAPDHWLIEVSGIPFGLPGQMLEQGGNPWRGMVYGITTRAGWTPNPPHHLWKFFDEYNFASRELIGYWSKDCPVISSDKNTKASAFIGPNDIVVALANWSDAEVFTELKTEVSKWGWKNYEVIVPSIQDFQETSPVSLERIALPAKKGIILVLKKK